jgi:hypothetical protein
MTSTNALTRRTFLGALAAAPVAAAVPTGAWASSVAAGSRDSTIGFVLDHGRIERIHLPGNGDHTVLSGITNHGLIVGKVPSRNGVGFDGLVGDVRRLRRFRFPGAQATYANKANDRGQIVGAANRQAPTVGSPGTFGFLLDRERFTRIAVPGAVYTQAFGMNNRGDVVGEYLKADGTFPLTFVTDINDQGQIAGYALSDLQLTEVHGFLLADGVGGPIAQIDVRQAPRTAVYGLDDRGRLVGVYDNPNATRDRIRVARAAPLPLGLSSIREIR